MKRTVFATLILCLAVGIPLVVLDLQHRADVEFSVPDRFAKLVVDLNAGDRVDELLLERQLSVPSTVELVMQSDSEAPKRVTLVSESGILGRGESELEFWVGRFVGSASTSATLVLPAGRYALHLTSEKHTGQLVIGYRDTPIELKEFDRLSKIHRGDLTNPPVGYREAYCADLVGLNVQNEVVYTLFLESWENIGISIYTSATQGTLSVDMTGGTSSWLGVVSPLNRICDQMELSLPPGEYQIKLACAEADGQLYVYLKRNGRTAR